MVVKAPPRKAAKSVVVRNRLSKAVRDEVTRLDLLDQELPGSVAAEVNSQLDAVLLKYQQDWIADDSDLKVAEKSRRIGL
ncbi:MAG TPA: hypothetical protein VGE22_15375, partial [Solimonas sp.]